MLELAQIRAEDFLRNVVRERLQAKEVYLGRGFFFGHQREGNIDLLRSVRFPAPPAVTAAWLVKSSTVPDHAAAVALIRRLDPHVRLS